MQSNSARIGIGAILIAAAVVLFIALRGGDDSGDEAADTVATATETTPGGQPTSKTSTEPSIPTIVIKGGKPVGGVQDLTYVKGDRVRFRVDSDVSDEVHVHGYDISKDVEAGGSVSFDFAATIEGIFEAELEGRVEEIAEITVNP